MRILVDFLPLMARGGGLQNARNLWREIRERGGDHRWLVFARPDLGLEGGAPHAELVAPDAGSTAARFWFQNAVLPGRARAWGADVVWTPMGVGPLRGRPPRVMGWHDSSVAYPESPVQRMLPPGERLMEGLRGALGGAAARRAEVLTVQTPVMRRRLSRLWGVPEERFHVVPNGPSGFLAGAPPVPESPPEPPVVLVVAEPKPAKNLEVVPWVARALRAEGPPGVKVVMTVPPPPAGPWTGPLEASFAQAGPGVPVERIGRVPHDALAALYRSAAAVFVPSHVESFSATYVEAMHFGVPLVTSDRDFARELCGEAAVYVEPEDAPACARALARVITDAALRRRLREAGFARVRHFPRWDERFALYLEALERAAARGRAA